MDNNKRGYYHDVKCGRCEKRFIPAPQNIFKKNDKQYCSWSCFNHRNDAKKQIDEKDGENTAN